MRKLKVKDIAPAIKLVKLINCGEEIKEIVNKSKNENEAGMGIIGLILTKYSESENIQKKLCEFLAGPFEMTAEEVEELDINEFFNGIKAIGGVGAITDFFGTVLR